MCIEREREREREREKGEARMRGGGVDEGIDLEFTPTWVVAVVCSVIVGVSFAVERLLHYAGKRLKKKNQKTLYEALLKIKEGSFLSLFNSFFFLA